MERRKIYLMEEISCEYGSVNILYSSVPGDVTVLFRKVNLIIYSSDIPPLIVMNSTYFAFDQIYCWQKCWCSFPSFSCFFTASPSQQQQCVPLDKLRVHKGEAAWRYTVRASNRIIWRFSHPNSMSTHLTVDTRHVLHICQYLQRRGHFYSVARAFSVGEAMLRSGLLTNTSRYSKHSQSHLVVN